MYVLYGGRFTRALLVEMVMAEGGIDYELREVDIINQAHRAAPFLEINPAGHVPAMITPEGTVLCETPAINLYLAERHNLTELAPTADDPDRGVFLSGLFFLTGDLEPVMKRYFYPHRYVLHEDDSTAMRAAALQEALERFAVVEQRLAEGGPYHLGGRFSLVDLTLAFWACNLESWGLLDSCPSVQQAVQRVKDRPRLQHKFEDLDAWRVEYQLLQARGEGVR